MNICISGCKQSGNEVIILKLDFAKAFDTVEHQAKNESFGMSGL
jgi:hypothetical protein